MMIRDTNIKIDRDRCIVCGICVDRCVMDNLRLSVAPCRQSCPLHINCQGVMKLIAKGEERQAVDLLHECLPFLGLIGLFCHAPCEKVCARKKVDKPVQIRVLHRYLAEHASQYFEEAVRRANQKQSGKKVGIWGTGPAAMMAAWRLYRTGHEITMLDSEKEPGGGLLAYRSTSDSHAQAIGKLTDAIAATGIYIKTGTEPLTFKELLNTFEAIIITYRDSGELSWILNHNDIDEKSFQIDPQTLQVVGQEQMFACKEFESDRPHFVNALANGVTAYESAHRFLSNMPLMWARGFWDAQGNSKKYAPPYERAMHIQHENNTVGRLDTKEKAVFEAQRCLGCGRPFDQNQTCWYCLPCELDCPTNAIEVRIPYLLR